MRPERKQAYMIVQKRRAPKVIGALIALARTV
jgi:hypothetical protein